MNQNYLSNNASLISAQNNIKNRINFFENSDENHSAATVQSQVGSSSILSTPSLMSMNHNVQHDAYDNHFSGVENDNGIVDGLSSLNIDSENVSVQQNAYELQSHVQYPNSYEIQGDFPKMSFFG